MTTARVCTPFFALLSCLSLSSASSTGSGRANYNVYNYDLTTPMFTPDGRLMQVEYASLSSQYSSPLVAVPVVGGGRRGDESGVVMAVLGDRSNRRRGQRRILEIPVGPSHGSSVVLGLAGVLADNLALVREVRQHVESWQRMYGYSNVPFGAGISTHDDDGAGVNDSVGNAALAARRVARVIGDCCQGHSFGGGIRPYGATVLVCGVHPGHENIGCCTDITLCTTHPSGSVLQYTANMAGGQVRKDLNDGDHGRRRVWSTSCVVVGGSTITQNQIRARIDALLSCRCNEQGKYDESGKKSLEEGMLSTVDFRAATEAAVTGLLEYHDSEQKISHSLESATVKAGTTEQSTRKPNKESVFWPEIDIVLITARDGVHCLESEESASIVKSVRKRITHAAL